MKILVTNDDGIHAQGLWALAEELGDIAQVVVAAPDREKSAIGTAVTLRQPLRVQKVSPQVPGVEAYAVGGTPADSVILALGKLIQDKVDMVVSGINQGPNLGNDVLISGTVGAALQGYLSGLPALAISIYTADSPYLHSAAKLARLLAKRVDDGTLPGNVFFNVNLPDLPPAQIKGIKITRLARQSHIDTVEEGHDGNQAYYWLVRQQIGRDANRKTDIWAIEHGHISITPLHVYRSNRVSSHITDSLCSELFQELRTQ